MTTQTRFHFIGVAVMLAYLLIALFAILLAGLLLFLLTHLVEAVRSLPPLLALLMGGFSKLQKPHRAGFDSAGGGESTGKDGFFQRQAVVLDDNGTSNPTVGSQSWIFSDTRTGDGGFQKAMAIEKASGRLMVGHQSAAAPIPRPRPVVSCGE